MTGTLRSTARNPVAIALMGLLILVFLLLGVGGGGRLPDAFRTGKADSVITAGSHEMSANDYRRMFQQQKQSWEAQARQPLTNEFIVQNGVDLQLLNAIGQDQAQLEMLKRAGIVPDPSLIDAQIKRIPQAFDRVTGKFSESQFKQILAAQGLTPEKVQELLGDELAERHFALGLAGDFKAPRLFAAVSAIQGLQNRDVSFFVLDPRAVVQPAPPSDAELTAYMKANAAQLTRPEMRTITLARFSAAALAPTMTVSPADIQKEFDFRKDTLSQPETRTIIQVPVRGEAEGAQAAKRLGQGEDPRAIAKSYGAEPIVYTDKPRTAIADSKLAAVAFSMNAGQVSGPVKGDLGLAALKVEKVTPGKTVTLDEARGKIEADLKLKAAQAKAYDLSQKFDQARQSGANVADAAAKAGVPAVTVGPFTAEGAGADGRPDPAINDKISKSAFAMRVGEDSDIQDSGPGEYFALKVDKITPPALRRLDEVRGPLTQNYLHEKLMAALRAKADALMAEIRQGKSMDDAAASVGAKVTHQGGMQLIQARQYQALGRDFLAAIFGHKAGDVFDAGAPTGAYIARLDAIRPGDVETTARFLEAIMPRASQDELREILDSTKTAAARDIKVTINTNLARKTVGVDPASLPASSGLTSTGRGAGAAK
jgi:peptidyl-prolyl cis-trans isomerase D